MRRLDTTTALAVALGWMAMACSEGSAPAAAPKPPPSPTTAAPSASPPPVPAEPEPSALVAEGREAYLGNCIACHNPDPKLDGALGPAVAGSPEDLVRARILRAEYPPGYTPKRTTAAMIAMPFLESRIPAIAAYLASEG